MKYCALSFEDLRFYKKARSAIDILMLQIRLGNKPRFSTSRNSIAFNPGAERIFMKQFLETMETFAIKDVNLKEFIVNNLDGFDTLNLKMLRETLDKIIANHELDNYLKEAAPSYPLSPTNQFKTALFSAFKKKSKVEKTIHVQKNQNLNEFLEYSPGELNQPYSNSFIRQLNNVRLRVLAEHDLMIIREMTEENLETMPGRVSHRPIQSTKSRESSPMAKKKILEALDIERINELFDIDIHTLNQLLDSITSLNNESQISISEDINSMQINEEDSNQELLYDLETNEDTGQFEKHIIYLLIEECSEKNEVLEVSQNQLFTRTRLRARIRIGRRFLSGFFGTS